MSRSFSLSLSLSSFDSLLSAVQCCCRNWCSHCVVSLLRSLFQSNCHYFTIRYFENLPFKFVINISFHSKLFYLCSRHRLPRHRIFHSYYKLSKISDEQIYWYYETQENSIFFINPSYISLHFTRSSC